MTRWKPNLAPVDEMPDQKQTEESRLIKIGRQADAFAAQKAVGDDLVVQEMAQQPGSGEAVQKSNQNPSGPSATFNPLDDASIDDLGSFLEMSSEESSKDPEPATKEVPQTKPDSILSKIKPFLNYVIMGLVIIALSVVAYFTYNTYYSDSSVATTVYILNSHQSVHDEAIRLTDSGSMSNFVQRFFISAILERSLASENRMKFSSASAMLDWFTRNLKVNRDISDHAARITFSLSGADPEMMGKLIDGYIGSYIDSKVTIDAQTPLIEPVISQTSALPRASLNVSTDSGVSSVQLKTVDEKLQKLDQTDQEYVSALRLLSKDRLIGVSDSNVFRGFMPESDLASNSALAKLQSRVVELAVQKNALQVKFSPASREIQAIEQEIRGIREAMRQYLNEQRQFVQARRGELLSERAEVLRQKAVASVESEITSPSPPQMQQSQQKRKPSLGNLPSGRFWYVGQDGTTIIAEPTYLGKSLANAAPNRNSGSTAQEIAQAMSYGQMNNNYNQNPYNNAPQSVQPMNQTQHLNNHGLGQSQAMNTVQNITAQKPVEYDQQIRFRDSQLPSQSLDTRQNYTSPSPPVHYPQYNYHSSPLHTGVSQSPMMSSGLGSKFYQPNSTVKSYQTQPLRGTY